MPNLDNIRYKENRFFRTTVLTQNLRYTCQDVSNSRSSRVNPTVCIDVAIIIYVRMFSLLESNVSDKKRLSRTRDQALRLPLTCIIGIVLRWRQALHWAMPMSFYTC